jgi:hypothetical protein
VIIYNYRFSIFSTKIHVGMLYICLLSAVRFGHEGHHHAIGTFIITYCGSVHGSIFTC